MPTHISSFFRLDELRTATLAESFHFTKGVPVLKTSGEIKLTITPQGTKPDFSEAYKAIVDSVKQ